MPKQELKNIIAPSLTQPGYGRGIDEQFRAINENFKILGNRDFVKGDRGYSVRSNTIYLSSWSVGNQTQLMLTKYGIQVMDTIIKEYCGGRGLLDLMIYANNNITTLPDTMLIGDENTQDTLRYYLHYVKDQSGDIWQPIRPLKISGNSYLSLANAFDGGYMKPNINDDDYEEKMIEYEANIEKYIKLNSFKIIETYDPAETDKVYIPVASIAHWVFRDARFSSSNLSDEDVEKYSGLIDASCSVHMVTIDDDYNAGFEVLHDIPALYFDKDNNSFCWLIGNQKSGMIAQGPRGIQGINTRFFIFKAEKELISGFTNTDDSDGLYNVTEYMDANDQSQWTPLTDNTDMSIFNINDPCIACVITKGTNPSTEQEIEIPKFFYSIINTIVDDPSEGGLGKHIKIYCSSSSKVPDIFTNESFQALMSNAIGLNKPVRGLYVPFEPSTKPYGYKHVMWSESSQNVSNGFDTLRLSPVNYGAIFNPDDDIIGNFFNNLGKLCIDYPSIQLGQQEPGREETNLLRYNNGVVSLGNSLNSIELNTNNGKTDLTFNQSYQSSKIRATFGFGSLGWTFSGDDNPLVVEIGRDINGVRSQGSFIIKNISGSLLSFDHENIQSFNSEGPSNLYINRSGGDMVFGNNTSKINVNSTLKANNGLTVSGGLTLANKTIFNANNSNITNVENIIGNYLSVGRINVCNPTNPANDYVLNVYKDDRTFFLSSEYPSAKRPMLGDITITSNKLTLNNSSIIVEGDIDARGRSINAEKVASTFLAIESNTRSYDERIKIIFDETDVGAIKKYRTKEISWDDFIGDSGYDRNLYIQTNSQSGTGDGNIGIIITDTPYDAALIFNCGVKLFVTTYSTAQWDGSLYLIFRSKVDGIPIDRSVKVLDTVGSNKSKETFGMLYVSPYFADWMTAKKS